jgi:hypothetical protein
LNPLDNADVVFKDEGSFWTIEAQTAAGRAFMRRTRLVSEPHLHLESRTRPGIVSSRAKQARALMDEAESSGLLVFEF